MKSAYIFRRDLRLNDNTALLAALEQSDTVTAFCLDPRQVGKNEYKSDNAIEFMFNSLTELAGGVEKERAGNYTFSTGDPPSYRSTSLTPCT